MNDGTTYLNVKIGKKREGELDQFVTLKEKLTASYGDEFQIDMMSPENANIIQIDLRSWQMCMESKQGIVDETDSESDDDPIDRDLYLA